MKEPIFGIIHKLTEYSKGNPIELDKNESAILLSEYINDKNSSTLRELITLFICEVFPLDGKLNYDGYDNDGNFYEVKPINITDEKIKKKLDGGGYYTDLTWVRHQKYLRECPVVLVSGFINGKICYVFKFPYHVLAKDIEKNLLKHLGEKDIPNRYMRKFKFTFRHWKDTCEVKYITDDETLLNPKYIVKDFFNFLNEKKQETKKGAESSPSIFVGTVF